MNEKSEIEEFIVADMFIHSNNIHLSTFTEHLPHTRC